MLSLLKDVILLNIFFGTDNYKIDITKKIDHKFLSNCKNIKIIDVVGDPAPNIFKKLWIYFK